MKQIIGFIRTYYYGVNKPVLFACTGFIALFIGLNYHYQLEKRLINHEAIFLNSFTDQFLIYLLAFLVPYLFIAMLGRDQKFKNPWLLTCIVLSPLLFAIKVRMSTTIFISADHQWNNYWNDIIYWPLRMIVLVAMLFVCKQFFHKKENFYGLSGRRLNYTPYLIMLLAMMPLIAAASTQPDFLATYPKMRTVLPLPAEANPAWFYKLLFELSYGTDFFSIEIFFRGFLIIGFIKWVGKDAILPMACFYCSIHFGKPLGECISSYFGGLLLGIVSYNTRSIYGGLIVHLGIAWLMELGGYIGNLFK